jgi:acyl-CoA reductase-like NAD-dependent aldehyde dehydrogenase
MATAEEQRTEIEVHNPATGELIQSVHATTVDELRAMAERGRAAQPAWEALGFDGRGKILRRAQKWVTDNAERIAETLVKESGKTYEDALLAEVAYAANAFGFWAKHAPDYLGDEKVRTSNPFVLGRKLVVRYRPVGLVGVIGPWNYPLTNSFGDCIPAMAAGNAVILKPAEATPLTSLLLAEGMAEVGLPEGVYQVAPGRGSEIGPELVDLADMIMFTGSTEVGKSIMARASDTLTPVSLELGGKDPMIVLADADVERAANAAAFYSMQNGGQTCISVERVYVEAPIYDDFVARVAQKVGALRQGVPTAVGTVEVGAMTIPSQVDTVSRHVEDAKKAGAKVLVGGHARTDKGHYYEPTVLVDVDHSMSAMTEETFGPTLPIMKVADADEAVRLANDSPFGLAASVWSKDAGRAEEVARRVEAGAVCVNDAQINYLVLELPMGGWKTSGMGQRHGAPGIRKYTRQQSLLITRLAPKRDLHMFPYKPRTTNLLVKGIKLLYGRGKRD